jgi:hypothetical protein
MSPSYRPSTKSSLRFSSVVAQGAATKRRAPAASPLLPPLPDRRPTRPIQAPHKQPEGGRGLVRVGGDYLNSIRESIAYVGVSKFASTAASGSA